MARALTICYNGAMKLKRLVALVFLSFTLFALGGCENLSGVRQSLEEANKLLAPLAVIKKGSGS